MNQNTTGNFPKGRKKAASLGDGFLYENRSADLDEAKLLLHLGQGSASHVGGLLGALLHLCLQLCLIRHVALELLLDGGQGVGADLTHGHLEVAVALSVELPLDLLQGLAREHRVDGHEVVDAVLVLCVADAGVRIRDGALELADNGIAVIQDVHHGVGVLVGLAHLLGGIGQGHDLGAALSHDGLWDGEGIGVNGIEAGSNVAAQLHVLLLVDAHGHHVGLVKQDIRGHEDGIGEKAGVDVVGVLLGLILELGHAGQLAKAREAVEQP